MRDIPISISRPKTLGARAFRLAGRVMGFDPLTQLKQRRYALSSPNWPQGFALRVVMLADLHACEPWMDIERVAHICDRANALEPDIVLLLGDFVTAVKRFGKAIPAADWARVLSRLRAPLGVHAVLGNHDWEEDPEAQARRSGPCVYGAALLDNGIAVYENTAVRLEKDGQDFWIAGLGDQRAFSERADGNVKYIGVDDLDATLAGISGEAPVILMAHEPDIFPRVPKRVSLTLSGHTHGGQIKLFGRTPVVPSVYGSRFVYGHIREDGRDLIVSGGLGCSGIPIRFGVPPEINLIELGGMA